MDEFKYKVGDVVDHKNGDEIISGSTIIAIRPEPGTGIALLDERYYSLELGWRWPAFAKKHNLPGESRFYYIGGGGYEILGLNKNRLILKRLGYV